MRISKRIATVIATLSFLLVTALAGLAHGNDRDEAKVTVGSAKVSISYGRPTLKGRDLKKMIQPGQMWRIGADAPTTFESDTDLDFGGTRVQKGKHILLARFIEPGKWTLVFSKKSVFQYEPSAKVAEVPLEFGEGKDPAEELTIKLANQGGRGVLEIVWGTMRLTTSFAPAK